MSRKGEYRKCQVCGDAVAVVRVVAADAHGTVLDVAEVCCESRCIAKVGELLAVGEGSLPQLGEECE